VIYLERAEILWINRTFITEKGGCYYQADDNILNRNSFELTPDVNSGHETFFHAATCLA